MPPVGDDRVRLIHVNSTGALTRFLEAIDRLPTVPPSLYVDGEWSRGEGVKFLDILVEPRSTIYRIPIAGQRDLFLMFMAASTGASLTSILESPSVPKVFFNARSLSYILWKCHAVWLSGIHELQLMELASRDPKCSKKYVAGLSECEEQETARLEEIGVPLPHRYGYCLEDIVDSTLSSIAIRHLAMFPTLWEIYDTRLCCRGQAFWLAQVQSQTTKRLADSRDPDFDPGVEELALGPVEWADDELRRELVWDWNMGLMQQFYFEP